MTGAVSRYIYNIQPQLFVSGLSPGYYPLDYKTIYYYQAGHIGTGMPAVRPGEKRSFY